MDRQVFTVKAIIKSSVVSIYWGIVVFEEAYRAAICVPG